MPIGPEVSPESLEDLRKLPGPIVVLGAGGFIGSNLYRMLAGLRSDVIAVVRTLPAWRLEGIDSGRIRQVDLADPVEARELVEKIGPQVVFDCVTYGGYSFETQVERIYTTNLTMKVQLLEILAEKGFAAYVHGGSSSEYGLNCQGPAETAPLLPNSHYAVAKAGFAQYLAYLGKTRHLPCANLRLYAVYGPMEDGARLIPTLIARGLEGRYPDFVNPEISRDFVHVDDVCEAFIAAAARLTPEIYGESFNIGSGEKTTIRDLAALAGSLFKIAEAPVFASMENRHWDRTDWYSDPAKALAALGWRARIRLADGLLKTAEWQKASLEPAASKFAPDAGKRRGISAIIACYKDEQAIPIMYRRLKATFEKIGVDYEIIFVNDCSPDESSRVIAEISLHDPRVLGIVHSRNFGSQMAFRSGMELAKQDAVVLLDGDLQDPPELIEQFFHKWTEGFEIVYGCRISREMPFIWGLLYKAFYRVFAALSYIKIPHDAGDFSLIDRRAVSWLLRCPERDLFLRGLRAYIGFRQTGVDYVRPERMFGTSTNSLLKNIEWAKRGIFSFSNIPLTALSMLGAGMLLLSLLYGLVVVALHYIAPDWAPRGFASLALMILGFGGLNLFAVGTVGEYVGKLMIELKGRPRFIREQIIRHGITKLQHPDGHLE